MSGWIHEQICQLHLTSEYSFTRNQEAPFTLSYTESLAHLNKIHYSHCSQVESIPEYCLFQSIKEYCYIVNGAFWQSLFLLFSIW